MIKNNWLEEMFTPYEKHAYKIKNIIVDTQTKFQKAILFEMEAYKKALVLDGEVQSTELDEYIYHESIVHPGMILHPNPKRVLILGGGEGATLREVLKHKSVKEVVMVDIDGEVVDFCKEHLEMFHKGAFDDPRTTLIIGDAKEYIYNKDEKFDVIISDLCCPLEDSPAKMLYTVEFYNVLKTRLTENGIFLAQTGPGDIPGFKVYSSIYATLNEVFESIHPFSSLVPSFIVPWGFQIALNNIKQNPLLLTKEEIDSLLDERLINNDLGYYDSVAHQRMFNMPKHLTKILKNETNIISEDKPCCLYK